MDCCLAAVGGPGWQRHCSFRGKMAVEMAPRGQVIENITLQHLFKKIPVDEQSTNKQSDTKSDNAVANNHEAHITSDGPTHHGPANERSNDEQSDAENDYAIADDREAHIAPDGPKEGRQLR